LVFLDGAKNLYGSVLDLLEPRLAPGAVIVADNADGSRRTSIERTISAYLSLRLHEEVELTIRV
jgi:predicted O-methyltransferase YrrM